MNRAEEAEFVWALTGQAKQFIGEKAYVWICAKIGAGEHQEAIEDVLGLFVRCGAALPAHLSALLWAWVNGFVGSEAETRIRDLACRLEISSTHPHSCEAGGGKSLSALLRADM